MLLLVLVALGAAQPYVVDKFDVHLKLEANGSMQVTERLGVTFNESKHGIFRDIPVDYDAGRGITRSIDLDQISVGDGQGNALTTKVTSEGDHVRIRIGDKDVTLPAGTRMTYQIHYRVRGMINWFDQNEGWGPTAQLYWNVTGDQWDTSIGAVSCELEYPKVANAKGVRARVFAGAYGSRDNQILDHPGSAFGQQTMTQLELTDHGLTLHRDQPLDAYNGLTVVLDMPSTLITKPTTGELAMRLMAANWGFTMPLFVLPFMLFMWLKYGRDPDGGPMVVQYDPPDDISGPEAGTLIDEQVDTRDISAGIFSLAVKGCLTIHPSEEGMIFKHKTATLILTGTPPKVPLTSFESKLLGLLEQGGPEVDETDLRSDVAPQLQSLKTTLYNALVDKGYYITSPEKARNSWFAGGCLTVVAVGLLVTALSPFGNPLPAVVGGFISLVIIGLFSRGMPRRTRAGSIAQAQVKGFEEFMRRARGDELEWMDKKHPDMALFEKYLPHAIAFGLAPQWAGRFQDIVKEMPSWYVTPYGNTFSPYWFGNDVMAVSNSIGTAAGTPPRSSGASGGGSGFSSGGFSGGGFGGGGGGSW